MWGQLGVILRKEKRYDFYEIFHFGLKGGISILSNGWVLLKNTTKIHAQPVSI